MLDKVREDIINYHMLEKGDRVVLGVSGGADSVSLFLALNELKNELGIQMVVVHVNHGIRGSEAAEDAKYVEQLCQKYEIPFYLFEEDIPAFAKKEKMTEEEAGRVYRYRCFWEVVEKEKADKLAVAHHMGDQAETVLFHLVRGTDLAGVTGMKPINGKIIRPLLSCRKEEITAWLEEKGIAWREDQTNTDNHYTRNKLRNQVLPLLQEINEGSIGHICAFARQMSAYEKFFQQEVEKYVSQWVEFFTEGDDEKRVGKTNRENLFNQELVLGKAVIYRMIAEVAGAKQDISKENVEAVYALLCKQSGKKVMLSNQIQAENVYENLIIGKYCQVKEQQKWEETVSIEQLKQENKIARILLPDGGALIACVVKVADWMESEHKDPVKNLKKSYTKVFDCDTIEDTLYVRQPEKDDYIVINENGNRKKLSRYFIDAKIPAKERADRLVVAKGHEVLWVIGGRRGESNKVHEKTEYMLVLTYEGEENE